MCSGQTVNIKSCIFGVGNFDARYFFGSKISGLCIFLGLQYEAPSDPPPPPPPPPSSILRVHPVGCDVSFKKKNVLKKREYRRRNEHISFLTGSKNSSFD